MSDQESFKGESIPSLSPFSLEADNITFECQTWTIPKTRKTGGLIAFKGFYSRGSEGLKHGQYIYYAIQAFCDMSAISALIVDFRELDYVWGNNLVVKSNNRIDIKRIVIPHEGDKPEQYRGFIGILGKEFMGTLGEESFVTDIRTAFRDIRLFFQN